MRVTRVSDRVSRIEGLRRFGEPQAYFHLDIRVTSRCNYGCYYCTDMHDNSNPFVRFDPGSLDRLVRGASSQGRPVHVFLYGGEPTLYPGIADFAARLAASLKRHGSSPVLEMQSNCALPAGALDELLGAMEGHEDVFRLSASFHNTKTTLMEFLPKVLAAKRRGMLGMVTFMYNSRSRVMEDFERARLFLGADHVEISPLISSSVREDPTEGQGDPFGEIDHVFRNEDAERMAGLTYVFQRAIPYELFSGERGRVSRADMWHMRCNSFRGFLCHVSEERCIVDWDGAVYGCFNGMFLGGEPLFNINEAAEGEIDGYFASLRPMVCPYDKCFFELEHMKECCDADVRGRGGVLPL
jgi:hypothetical protein